MSHETDEKRYAAVEVISDKIKWNAHAALGDALNRAPINAELMVVWIQDDGKLRWSKACDNRTAVYMMHAACHKVTFDD